MLRVRDAELTCLRQEHDSAFASGGDTVLRDVDDGDGERLARIVSRHAHDVQVSPRRL